MPKLTYDSLIIGGEFVAPKSTEQLALVSPVTEDEIRHVPSAPRTDVDRAVAAAREAFDHGGWPETSLDERLAVKGLDAYLVHKSIGLSAAAAEVLASEGDGSRYQ